MSEHTPTNAIKLHGGSGYSCHGWEAGQVIWNRDRHAGSTRVCKIKEIDARLKQWKAEHPGPEDWQYVSYLDPTSCWRPPKPGEEPAFAAKKAAAIAEHQEKLANKKLYEAARAQIYAEYPDDDGPEFLYVLTASRQYIREDGMSCGVGDEQGWVYSATCRPATDEESAPLQASIALEQRRNAARAELKEIAVQIAKTGERPAGRDNVPEGDRISETQNICGGGDSFVIGPSWIWYVLNNGRDGDDWSLNNVKTGGAGAIGWRVPYNPELADRLRSLADSGGS